MFGLAKIKESTLTIYLEDIGKNRSSGVFSFVMYETINFAKYEYDVIMQTPRAEEDEFVELYERLLKKGKQEIHYSIKYKNGMPVKGVVEKDNVKKLVAEAFKEEQIKDLRLLVWY